MREGFRERSSAFEFQSAIQDHIRSVQRSKKADKEQELYDKADEGDEAALAAIPHKDFSMKEGQTFSISLGGGTGAKTKKKAAATGGPSKCHFHFLLFRRILMTSFPYSVSVSVNAPSFVVGSSAASSSRC